MAFLEGGNEGTLNGTTPVDIVAAPGAATRRIVRSITIYNADTAVVEVSIYKDVSGTPYLIAVVNLDPGDTWLFGDGGEVVVLDATTKKIAAVMGGAAATTNPDFNASYADVS